MQISWWLAFIVLLCNNNRRVRRGKPCQTVHMCFRRLCVFIFLNAWRHTIWFWNAFVVNTCQWPVASFIVRFNFFSVSSLSQSFSFYWIRMEIRVKPFIVSPECEQRQLILLFLSNLLRAESDQKIVCANATSLNQLSNWEIATLIFGACIIISIMFASLCCIFFWWQKKKANRRNNRESTGYQLSSTPVIRSDDVISFVLPSVTTTY